MPASAASADSRITALIAAACGGSLALGAALATYLQTRRSACSASSTDQDEDDDLRAEMNALRRTNAQLQSVVDSSKSTSFGSKDITAAERETLRAVFSCYDGTGSGVLTVEDIVLVHSKLGEPLTDSEAKQAMAELDRDGTGFVTFEQFLKWWLDNHRGPEKGDKYRARFQLIRAKMGDNRLDVRKIQTQKVGKLGSRRFRVKFYYKQRNNVLRQLSPWHDIPLYNLGVGVDAKILNFVCEIPKWTRLKFEIATGEPFNPIKQDVKNGQLRSYKFGDMMFNYGALPQTWEDPSNIPSDTGFPGDNDPIDCIEIGTRQMKVGEVAAIKVLGVLALIDDNETDWKVLSIAINDPLAHELDDIDDVEEKLPGAVHAIREYFRVYKTWSGTPENTFALDEEAMPKDYALRVIEHTHRSWQALRNGKKHTV